MPLLAAAVLVAACSSPAASAGDEAYSTKEPPRMLSITETENGRTVDIRLGESVRINLPENATSGYRWAIDHFNKSVLEPVAAEPQYQASGVGSGGLVAFVFKGKKAGSGEVTLKYWRHWEGDASVINRFHIRLHVQP